MTKEVDVLQDGTVVTEQVYPTARDVLFYSQPHIMVRYMNDHLASLIPDHVPNPNWFQMTDDGDDVETRCRRDHPNNQQQHRSMKMGDRVKNLEQYYENETTTQSNNLRGSGDNDANDKSNLSNIQKDEFSQSTLPTTCQQQTLFTRQEDRQRWIQLCKDMPPDSTVADRLAAMAEMDCEERNWKPRTYFPGQQIDGSSNDSQNTNTVAAIEQWITSMGKAKEIGSFECFHRPNRPIRK